MVARSETIIDRSETIIDRSETIIDRSETIIDRSETTIGRSGTSALCAVGTTPGQMQARPVQLCVRSVQALRPAGQLTLWPGHL